MVLLPLKLVLSSCIPSAHTYSNGSRQGYTVDFDRNGQPKLGHVVGRLSADNTRFLANHADDLTLSELSSRIEESIGTDGWVESRPKGRNLFNFQAALRL